MLRYVWITGLYHPGTKFFRQGKSRVSKGTFESGRWQRAWRWTILTLTVGNRWVKFRIIQWIPCLSAWAAACLALAPAAPASAQVMDIRPDGTTATYQGPVITLPDGMRPLASTEIPATGIRAPVADAIRAAAIRHAVGHELVEAVAWQESRFRQSAVSPKGARGVMQLMPATAARQGVDAAELGGNVDGGAAYLAQMLERFDGDVIKALAAYNAGPEAVARYNGVPPYAETQHYVNAVLERMAMTEVSR